MRAALDELLLHSDDIELGQPTIRHPSLISNMTVYDSLPIRLTTILRA